MFLNCNMVNGHLSVNKLKTKFIIEDMGADLMLVYFIAVIIAVTCPAKPVSPSSFSN